MISGSLIVYDREKGLAAFESRIEIGGNDSHGYFLLIGGLGDGLGFADYASGVAETVSVLKWTMVQPLLSSSLGSYGHCTLQDDVQDLDSLMSFLIERFGKLYKRKPKFVLMGHSTGCQDTVTYLKSGRYATFVSAVILQAPVSDREYFTDSSTTKYLTLARSMINDGKAKEMMCREAWDVPITAERYASLLGRLGDDDMFSSDLSESELSGKIGHVAVPALLVFSQDDQYVPVSIDKRALGARLACAMPMSVVHLVFVEGGSHSLESKAPILCSEVRRFLDMFISIRG